jgi:hypothetical protein
MLLLTPWLHARRRPILIIPEKNPEAAAQLTQSLKTTTTQTIRRNSLLVFVFNITLVWKVVLQIHLTCHQMTFACHFFTLFFVVDNDIFSHSQKLAFCAPFPICNLALNCLTVIYVVHNYTV